MAELESVSTARALAALATVLVACSGEISDPADEAARPDATPGDSGTRPDARPSDMGTRDLGTPDAGFPDASPVDAGFPDASPVDSGFPDASAVDAGFPDASPVDSGFPDAAPQDLGLPDSGEDAGSVDSGVVPDAGAVDAGAADAGVPAAPPSAYATLTIDQVFRHGQQVEVVNIDGDGDLDILVAISLTDTVRLYVSSGNGSTFTPVQVAPNNSIVAMYTTTDDFDGDGDLDVASVGLFDRAGGFTSRGNVAWYANPGLPTGTWTSSVVPLGTGNGGWGARIIGSGDLTGNGRSDLVVGSIRWNDGVGLRSGELTWHRNPGNGAFTAPTVIDAAIVDVEGLVVHDVDGDGVDDVIASDLGGGAVYWYENGRTAGQVQTSPSFTRHPIATVAGAAGIALGQMDADPELELVVGHDSPTANIHAVAWYDPPANPRQAWTRHAIGTFSGNLDVKVATGDLNDDGFTDVVVAARGGPEFRAFVRNPTGWTSQLIMAASGAVGVATGDLDGDRRDDVVGTTYDATPSSDSVRRWRSVP